MQTFLPHADYTASAKVLDRQRLGKQRVECKQILNALTDPTKGWGNHPATKMWRGHESSLCIYAITMCTAWTLRGYNDSLTPFFLEMLDSLPMSPPPEWLGDPKFHASHRSNLLRKDPEHYGQFGWAEPDNLEYVWPSTLH